MLKVKVRMVGRRETVRAVNKQLVDLPMGAASE